MILSIIDKKMIFFKNELLSECFETKSINIHNLQLLESVHYSMLGQRECHKIKVKTGINTCFNILKGHKSKEILTLVLYTMISKKKFLQTILITVNPGHNQYWNKQLLDKTCTGHNLYWTQLILDTTDTGHNLYWTQPVLDTTDTGHNLY